MKTFGVSGWVTRGANGNPGVKRRQVAGREVTSFRISSPEKDRNGNKKPAYFAVEYWHEPGDPADAVIQEDAKLVVLGKLDWHEWEDQQTGQKRSEVRLAAYDVGVSPQRDRQQGYAQQSYSAQQGYAPAPQYAPQPAYAPAPQPYPAAAPQYTPAPQAAQIYDEEIPF